MALLNWTPRIRYLIVLAALTISPGCSTRRPNSGLPVTIPPAEIPINPDPHAPKIAPDQLITAFHQGARGNCAVIAVIKDALGTFGAGYVVAVNPANPCEVTLQDRQKVILNPDSLRTIADKDGFIKGTDEAIFNEARFLYEVIVQRMVDRDTAHHYASLAAAADALNGGEGQTAKKIIPLLGLTAETDVAPELMATRNLIIVTSFYHAAFSSKGYYDEYGQKTLISDFKANHHKISIFHSSDISEAYQVSETSKPYPNNFN